MSARETSGTARSAPASSEARGRDLDDENEIAEMVRRFYADVAQDDLLGAMFNEVARVDWSEHLPTLTAFWCRALLSQPGYRGNPYRKHQDVHARCPFTRAHFERWLDLFHETLDLGWSGPKVEQAKALAGKVAFVHSKQIVGDPALYDTASDNGSVLDEEERMSASVERAATRRHCQILRRPQIGRGAGAAGSRVDRP